MEYNYNNTATRALIASLKAIDKIDGKIVDLTGIKKPTI